MTACGGNKSIPRHEFISRSSPQQLQPDISNTRLFISNTFISNGQAEIGKKIKQKLSNTLRLNFCFFKMIYFLCASYHPKVGHTLKNA